MCDLHEYTLYLTAAQRDRLHAALLEIGSLRDVEQPAGEVIAAAVEMQARALSGSTYRMSDSTYRGAEGACSGCGLPDDPRERRALACHIPRRRALWRCLVCGLVAWERD